MGIALGVFGEPTVAPSPLPLSTTPLRLHLLPHHAMVARFYIMQQIDKNFDQRMPLTPFTHSTLGVTRFPSTPADEAFVAPPECEMCEVRALNKKRQKNRVRGQGRGG